MFSGADFTVVKSHLRCWRNDQSKRFANSIRWCWYLAGWPSYTAFTVLQPTGRYSDLNSSRH